MQPYLVIALIPHLSNAAADTFQIEGGEHNRVRFESRAPLETFHGETSRVRGQITLDPRSLGDSIAVFVEVDLASLETGMALRDQHMRENHLETEKYPTATFRGGKIDGLSVQQLQVGEKETFEIEGVLDLHGITRRFRAPVEMELEAEESGVQLRVRTQFDVKLSDYDIPRPKFLVMKLNDTQRVELECVAASSAPIQ